MASIHGVDLIWGRAGLNVIVVLIFGFVLTSGGIGSGLRERIMYRLFALWICRGRGGRGLMGRLLLVGL